MTTNDRLYHSCYTALKIFHWILFVVTVEIAFWFAGWSLFGILDGALTSPLPAEGDKAVGGALTRVGQYVGLAGGLVFNWYILVSRYRQSKVKGKASLPESERI